MLRTALCAALGLLLLCPCGVTLACEQPSLPPMPATNDVGDGIARVVVAVQHYVVATREYVNCVRMELNEAGGDAAPVAFRDAIVRRNNNAIVEAETVLALFKKRVGDQDLLGFSEFLTSTSQRCIPRDFSAHALTDRVLLFSFRNGTAFLNVLEKACPGLALYDAFIYRLRGKDLCSNVRISPGSLGVAAGVECDLGDFLPITAEQASRLLDLMHR